MKAKHMVKREAAQQAPAPRLPSGDLSDGQIRAFADAVLAGEAHPEDARTVLKEFLRMARPGNVVSDAMIGFLAEAVERFMRGERGIMEALGLDKPRRRGRPRRDRTQCVEVATHVLVLRARGRSSEFALADAASKFHLGPSVIKERIAECSYDAIRDIRARAASLKLALTQKQLAKLDQLAHVTVRPRPHLRHPMHNRLAAIPPEYSS
jgi:hypothetical protein